MKSIGIDIGTTTISIVVVNNQDFSLLQRVTLDNDASLSSPESSKHFQK